MATYLTPGAYFKISDQDQRTIDFLRTDIAAFIGIAERGALHRPTRVNSLAQFNAIFGSFIPGGYLAYSVKAFFENGGNICYIVRVANAATAVPASLELKDHTGAITLDIKASSPGVWGERVAVQVAHSFGAATITRDAQPADRRASKVGSLVGFQVGSLVHIYQPDSGLPDYHRTVVDVLTVRSILVWDALLDAAFDLSKPLYFEIHDFTLSVYLDGRIAEVFTGLAFTENGDCDDPSLKCDAVTRVNDRSTLVRLNNAHSPALYADRLPVPTPVLTPLANGTDGLTGLLIEDFMGDPGLEQKWGLRTLENVDEVAVVAMPDILIQPMPSVVYRALPKPIRDSCIEPCPPESPAVAHPVPEVPPKFSREDIFAAQQALILHCETQRDRIALIDPPFPEQQDEVDLGEIQSWRQRFDSSYAALYYPWVVIYDPLHLGGQIVRPIPPSGHVAGIIARSDTAIGVHKAPANEALSWAQDVMVTVNAEMQGILNPMAINCIRPLLGRGLRVYGARTMSSDLAWRFVNVRRLLMMIEEALDKSLQWAVFEPNDFNLRQMLILTIGSFLRVLWSRGALVGTSEEDAFFVKCDDENNPPDLGDLGQLVIDVGVAPVKPAEFVVFSIGRVDNVFQLTEQRGM